MPQQTRPLPTSRYRLPAVRAKRRTRGLRLPGSGWWAARWSARPSGRAGQMSDSSVAVLGSRVSDLRPRTSDLRPQTSDLRPQTSDLRPQTSDLRPQTSDLRPAQLALTGERSSGQATSRYREASAHAFGASRERQAVCVGRPVAGDLQGRRSAVGSAANASGAGPRERCGSEMPGRPIVVTARSISGISPDGEIAIASRGARRAGVLAGRAPSPGGRARRTGRAGEPRAGHSAPCGRRGGPGASCGRHGAEREDDGGPRAQTPNDRPKRRLAETGETNVRNRVSGSLASGDAYQLSKGGARSRVGL
ncbi:hypothetical protein Poly30_20620 [Planctomycetes bacterium Poly30]|uniref:Uncharacterized protein n=1 Tax=Saltatorellus ferox TaxID=2528018 RepID=A0A518ER36_9BACT|nr:hypothetical protein Poly30_20620 [Planctomycetes bacterium Poly30]